MRRMRFQGSLSLSGVSRVSIKVPSNQSLAGQGTIFVVILIVYNFTICNGVILLLYLTLLSSDDLGT